MLFALMSSFRRTKVDVQTWQDAGKIRNGVERGKKALNCSKLCTAHKNGGYTWKGRAIRVKHT
ncbi:hypothetical protein DPMN_194796 [Dreissena polymorpha]|uniref:Uncharacterized protein n=1 Tax=Dreissena polymorpha TaxID=45954 RepID=A0A9D3Y3H3_DREPO|nr:hypothetical protein DPMN_194796 [Dreissena polymorpha]